VTVTGRIAGPVPPGRTADGDSCAAADWSDAPTFSSYGPATWTGEPLQGLGRASPTEPGCYSAEATQEVTHGGKVISALQHALGLPEQTILVTAPVEPTPSPSPSPEPSPEPSAPPSPAPTPTPTPTPTPAPTPSAQPPASPAPSVPVPAAPGTRPRPGLPSTGG
ncbi:hypothetical protein ACFQ06_15790, partial [Tessaracoccus lubricantis]